MTPVWVTALLAGAAAPTLNLSPRAVDSSTGATVTVSVAPASLPPQLLLCTFDGTEVASPCVTVAHNATACRCQVPTSPQLVGDVMLSLVVPSPPRATVQEQLESDDESGSGSGEVSGDAASGAASGELLDDGSGPVVARDTSAGLMLGNATLTYYDARQAPELLAIFPSSVACRGTGGGAVLSLHVRNWAPTPGLLCDFGGAVGRGPAQFTAAAYGARNRSVGQASCAVPVTPLLGDLRVRVSHDGGVRWSAESADVITCYDDQSAPWPLSVAPASVDVATQQTLALRARNLRRGPLLCRLGDASSLARANVSQTALATNGTVGNITLATPTESVGAASCPLPPPHGHAGALPVSLSADDGASWSVLDGPFTPSIVIYDSSRPPLIAHAAPRSLAVGDVHAGGAMRGTQELRVSGVNFASEDTWCVLSSVLSRATLVAAPYVPLQRPSDGAARSTNATGANLLAQLTCAITVPSDVIGEVPLTVRGPAPQPDSSPVSLVLYDDRVPPRVGALPTPTRGRRFTAGGSLEMHVVNISACNVPGEDEYESSQPPRTPYNGPHLLLCGTFDMGAPHGAPPLRVSTAAVLRPPTASPMALEAAGSTIALGARPSGEVISTASSTASSPAHTCLPDAIVRCEVVGSEGASSVGVRLSHDGGASWSVGGAIFSLWSARGLAPTSGPSGGGTTLEISGEALPSCDPAAGCACLVGNVSVPAVGGSATNTARCVMPPLPSLAETGSPALQGRQLASDVEDGSGEMGSGGGVELGSGELLGDAASGDAASGELLADGPSGPRDPRTVSVGLTFDGHVASTEALLFTYYSPPVVSSLSLTLLPHEGGVPLTLHGDGFAGLATHSTRCGFGAGTPSGPVRYSTPATHLSPTSLLCRAPSSGEAGGAAAQLRLEMGARSASAPLWLPPPPQQAALTLLGASTVERGTLILTTAAQHNRSGSAWIEPAQPHAPLTHFSLHAELVLGGGSSADGMSICYGPPTEAPFGEIGVDEGLVLRLRTFTHMRAELVLNGVMLASAQLDAALRGRTFIPIAMTVDSRAGVTVRMNATLLLTNVTLPADPADLHAAAVWRPHHTWRIGFGARTGDLSAEHRVRSVVIRSPFLASQVAVPVEVSGNGGADFSSGGALLTYAQVPVVSSLHPAVGPVHGGTSLELRGLSLCAGLPTRVRLGGTLVVADTAGCPAGATLNASTTTVSSTILSATGDASHNASHNAMLPLAPAGVRRWRWPSASPPPAQLRELGRLRCTAPGSNRSAVASGSGLAEARIELSLNGVQWHDALVSFTYYEPPVWQSVTPAAGPTAGGTRVRVECDEQTRTRAGLAALQASSGLRDARCSFGGVEVAATVHPADGSMLCTVCHANEHEHSADTSMPAPAHPRVTRLCAYGPLHPGTAICSSRERHGAPLSQRAAVCAQPAASPLPVLPADLAV